MKIRLTVAAFAMLLVAASAPTSSGQQQFGQRFHDHLNHTMANCLGGSNCGRAITQYQAEGLWANYCNEDCTLNTGDNCGSGCSSCGSGGGLFGGRVAPMRGGSLFHHGRGDACSSSCGESDGGCSGHHGLLSRLRSSGGGQHHGFGSVGGDCGCGNGPGRGNGCFAWPSDCGCGDAGPAGKIFGHRHGGNCRQDSCGNEREGLFSRLHARLHSHGNNNCGQSVCGGLGRCGRKCGFFDGFHGGDCGRREIRSCVSGCGCDSAIGQAFAGNGCDGGSSVIANGQGDAPGIVQPIAESEINPVEPSPSSSAILSPSDAPAPRTEPETSGGGGNW